MQRLKWIVVAVGLMFFTACNYNYKKSDSGILYKIFSKGSGDSVKQGDFLKVHYAAFLGDSTLFNSYEHIPIFGQYDSSYTGSHDFIDIMGHMRVGDSAVYVRFVDSLVKKGLMQYNEHFVSGGTIRGRMSILGRYISQQAMDSAYRGEMDLERIREIAVLEAYAKEKKYDVKKTENGVLVYITEQGSGPKADTGMMVNMKYTGYLVDGTKFDSNTDSAFGHVGPFEFQVGTRQVIPGWDEAVPYFNKGGKGKILIPAMLAYGIQSQGDKLPGYSNLIFDIEVVDVNPVEAAPPAEMPAAAPAHH